MKNNGPGKELTDQMKKELREANTKEELSALISSAGTELEDDMLDAVAGGEGCKTQCGTFHSFCLTDGSI